MTIPYSLSLTSPLVRLFSFPSKGDNTLHCISETTPILPRMWIAKGLHPSEHLPDKRVKSVIFAQDHSLHLSSVFTRTPAGLLAKEIADVPGKQLGSPAM